MTVRTMDSMTPKRESRRRRMALRRACRCFPCAAVVVALSAGLLGASGEGLWAQSLWQRLKDRALQNEERNLQEISEKQRRLYEVAYAQSDFIAGREITFADNFEAPQPGAVAPRWRGTEGVARVDSVAGRKALALSSEGEFLPRAAEPFGFLSDVFTLEYDLFVCGADSTEEGGGGDFGPLSLSVCFGKQNQPDYWIDGRIGDVSFHCRKDGSCSLDWALQNAQGEAVRGSEALAAIRPGAWNHFAFAYDSAAFRVYVNGTRVVRIRDMARPGYWFFQNDQAHIQGGISDVRLAQGLSIPLERQLEAAGKMATTALPFENGTDTLKIEALGELLRIARVMESHPEKAFRVQAPTLPRARAIAQALARQGIAQSRLIPTEQDGAPNDGTPAESLRFLVTFQEVSSPDPSHP